MSKTLSRLALVMGLAAFSAASIEAAVPVDQPPAGIRVVNNYTEMVRVYAEDAEGKLHKLGRVAPGQLGEFAVPTELADEAVSIRVVPSQPAWSLTQDDFAVRSNPLDLDEISDVTFWVEPNLTRSLVEVNRG